MKRKPVTEWAGMTDWGMAGRKWKRGSGEGDGVPLFPERMVNGNSPVHADG